MAFSAEIIESYNKLSAKERIAAKDTTKANKLDKVTTENGKVIIKPVNYVVLSIHNDKAKPQDYLNYVIFDESGEKYVTGSSSFWQAFKAIWDEMVDEDEPYEIEVYRVDSKNYAGKQFLTCSIR